MREKDNNNVTVTIMQAHDLMTHNMTNMNTHMLTCDLRKLEIFLACLATFGMLGCSLMYTQ